MTPEQTEQVNTLLIELITDNWMRTVSKRSAMDIIRSVAHDTNTGIVSVQRELYKLLSDGTTVIDGQWYPAMKGFA